MLADASEPLILADGTRIDPSSGSVVRDKKYAQFVEVPSGTQAQAIVAKSRRSVAELPMQPGQMNIVSLVLFYAMWGLGVADIAIQTGISAAQVKNIQTLDVYIQLSEDIKKSVLEFEANDVRAVMQRHAMGAANKIVDLMDEEGALGFAAAKDILDRTGNRPADVVEHRHKMEDTLRIEIVERKPDNDVPTFINVTDYKEVTNGNRS
jgi:hypothetical protein